jgi:hypothetical protein
VSARDEKGKPPKKPSAEAYAKLSRTVRIEGPKQPASPAKQPTPSVRSPFEPRARATQPIGAEALKSAMAKAGEAPAPAGPPAETTEIIGAEDQKRAADRIWSPGADSPSKIARRKRPPVNAALEKTLPMAGRPRRADAKKGEHTIDAALASGAPLLQGAKLRGARLVRADLRGANLRGADLAQADLAYADLSLAVLEDADLSLTNLYKTKLEGAEMRGCDKTGTRKVNPDRT